MCARATDLITTWRVGIVSKFPRPGNREKLGSQAFCLAEKIYREEYKERMSGVWVFRNGVAKLVSNPLAEPIDGMEVTSTKRKVLVHLPTNEVVTSYANLERKLLALGWERYSDDPEFLQYHKASSVHLITLPRDFNKFKSVHMYDIVVKNRTAFEVRDQST